MINITNIKELALATPDSRNRYVDFLRAVSILMVVMGHWLIVGAQVIDGQFVPINVLNFSPSAQPLTWFFQVMPIFFIVGGFSNATSLASAMAKQTPYAQWLQGRLQRLFTPLLAVVLLWLALSLVFNLSGMAASQVAYASKAALIPAWFLAIYTLIVLLAPLSYQLWQRFGWWSWLGFVVLAIGCDWLFVIEGITWVGWFNYFFVWLAVHHLGYAWHSNRLPGMPWPIMAISVSFGLLHWLVYHGPYPIAMAGSPGDGISNSLPPKVTLLLLGILQFSVLIMLQRPFNYLLGNLKLWMATIFINAMIMSVYLWHMTVLLAVFALLSLLGGIGLTVEPASTQWWLMRPVWMIGLLALLLPLVTIVSPLERISNGSANPNAMVLIGSAILTGGGIALMALHGFTGELTDLLSWAPGILILTGTLMAGVRLKPTKP